VEPWRLLFANLGRPASRLPERGVIIHRFLLLVVIKLLLYLLLRASKGIGNSRVMQHYFIPNFGSTFNRIQSMVKMFGIS
jgi:hypothetical protein